MPRLLLLDRRAMNVGSHLVPAAGSSEPWRMTDASETLSHLLDALVPDLRRTPLDGLRLLAHGNSGRLQFTADGLDESNVEAMRALRGLIRGTVQLHGCAVASAIEIHIKRVQGIGNMHRDVPTPGSFDTGWGTTVTGALTQSRELDGHTGRLLRGGRGVRFLLAFASAIGLPTTAAMHAQEPDTSWRYEGPTMTAWPGGGLFLHIPPADPTFPSIAPGDYQVPR